MSGHTPIDFKALSSGEIEDVVDKGLRHRTGKTPRDYLEHWLYIGRHFGFATHDDSWGEFEKEFAIIIKRLVIGEREAAANEAKIEALAEALKGMLFIYVELAESGDAGFWDAEKVHEVIAARAALASTEAMKGEASNG